jgi:hypothetical protein
MKKSVWLTAVLFLLFSLTAVAQAAAEPVFCGDLAAADCALLQDAQTNAAAQTSGAVTMDVDLTLRNLDESMPGEQVISLDVDAIWNGDFSRFESMETEMLARMDDPTQLMAMMSEMLAGMSGTISVSVDIPEALQDDAFFEDFPAVVALEMRLVDGIAYIDLSNLASAMSAEDGIPAGWLGFDITELMQMAMQSGPGAADGMAPHSEGKEGKQDPREPKGADTMTGLAIPADMQEMVEAWSDPEFLGQFMSVERLEDQSVADQQAAVFQTNFDLRALMNSAEFHELLGVTGELGNMNEDQVSAVSMMVGMMTLGLDIEALRFINLDDGLPLREELHLNWDLSALMNLAEGSEDSSELESSFGLDFLIDFSFSDEELPVTAPEGAFLMPMEMMMGMDA